MGALGDILDVALLAGAAYVAYTIYTSPFGGLLGDLAQVGGTVLNQASTVIESVATNNAEVISQITQGNAQNAYEANCKAGFNPYRPDCAIYTAVNDSVDVGAGTPLVLDTCPAGWTNDGLTCREPIDTHGSPWAWEWTGGRVTGRLDNKTCPSGKEEFLSLCYDRCPASHPYRGIVFPYKCFKTPN